MNTRGQPVSVGRLLGLVKMSVGRAFGSVLVTGEVVDPLLSRRGHLYFRLSDGQAEIKAVMWNRDVQRLRAGVEAGDQVTVRGSLDVYAPRGDLQLVASALMQSGRGQKMLALAQLRSRLKAEGIFDRERRRLPRFPNTVGVVTSVGSAVIHDIYQSIQKRFPSCRILLSPAAVSGEEAPEALIRALNHLRARVEVVIVARGGGSFEELLPFSDEKLVRLVASFPLPVVAAVGHGSDQTLLDLVADHTAPTPTGAAVVVTPDREDLQREIQALRRRATLAVRRHVSSRRKALEGVLTACKALHPAARLERQVEKLENSRRHLRLLMESRVKSRRETLEGLARRLQSVGPRTLLSRGFAMIYAADRVVTSIQGRTPGEELELHFADGRIVAEIKRVESGDTH